MQSIATFNCKQHFACNFMTRILLFLHLMQQVCEAGCNTEHIVQGASNLTADALQNRSLSQCHLQAEAEQRRQQEQIRNQIGVLRQQEAACRASKDSLAAERQKLHLEQSQVITC